MKYIMMMLMLHAADKLPVTSVDLSISNGEQCLKEHHYKHAFAFLIDAARGGNARANYLIGNMYYKGNGVLQNYELAHQYFYTASLSNHPQSLFNLGQMNEMGYGDVVNIPLALSFYRLAANAGDNNAQERMGHYYWTGDGNTTVNHQMAIAYYALSSSNGNYISSYTLGMMYKTGDGVEKDQKKANNYFKKAQYIGCNMDNCPK